jgi:hypothetical protein
MLRPLGLSLLLTTLCATGAANAGTVYVPLPGLNQNGSYTYDAQIAVTNTAAQTNPVTQFLIANDTDGTVRPAAGDPLSVLPGRTLLVNPGATVRGLLELSGTPNLRYTARLTGPGPSVSLGVPLPVITSDNLVKAGKTATVQGLVLTTSRSSNLTVVNLAQTPATCTINLRRADGTAIGSPATIMLKPLSQRYFANVLNGQVDPGTADARADVSCAKDFYAYALLADSATGDLAMVPPAGSGESLLQVPGAAPVCPTGAVCFDTLGVVHTPTPATPVARVTYFPPAGVAKRLRLTMKVTVGAWYPKDPAGKHLIYWFVINKNTDMAGMLYFRGPDAYEALVRHGIALKHPEKLKILQPFQAIPGHTYLVDNDYDMGRSVYTVTITDTLTGAVVQLVGQPNVKQVTLKDGDKLLIDMGFPEGVTVDEVPSFGWNYSDVHVEVYK